MKGFVLAFALLVIAASAVAGPPTEFKHFREECKAEIGLTEEKPPHPDLDEPKAKCYYACMMKKLGKIVNGKVVLEKELETAMKILGPNMDESIKSKLTECVNAANAKGDECDAAHEMHKCVKTNKLLPPYN